VTEKEFGKVYVQRQGDQVRVEFTVWVDSDLERWQTGVALDASTSMKGLYGRAQYGQIPSDVKEEYKRKGWLELRTVEGRKGFKWLKREGFEDARKKAYLRSTDNDVQPLARDFIGYLARELDAGKGVAVIYWACGDGSACEVLGQFTENQCRTLDIHGPEKHSFGTGTKLTPALGYFLAKFPDAERAMYVFITDGALDDLEEVKHLTIQVARDIEAGKRNPVKCVLVGLGKHIDEGQMEELDDLDTGTDVDIWDHKIAEEMRALSEIMVELADENRIVAPTATVYDASGAVVAKFADGLPARAEFSMSASSPYFELEAGGRRIRQHLATPSG
jgi:hypothetical protein